MKVKVYDKDLVKKTDFFNWISLLWECPYNKTGKFIISLGATKENVSAVDIDNYLMYDEDETNTVMIVKSKQIVQGVLTLTGFSLDWIFSKRVSNVRITEANAESAIHDLVSTMEPWDHVELGASAGLTDIYNGEIEKTDLLDYIQNMTQACDIGYKFIKNNDRLVFTLYKPGQNQNVKFAQALGNLTSETYLITDQDYANVALVVGETRDDEVITEYAGETTKTGIERREIIVNGSRQEEDESETNYRKRLRAEGIAELAEQIKYEEIGFMANDNVFLGEVIPVYLDKLGLSVVSRINCIRTKHQNGKITKTIEVGEPISIKRRKT